MSPEEWKAKFFTLERLYKRNQKKHVEYMRRTCQLRSRDHKVNVCDADEGPARCNKNTLKDCPHYIFVYGTEE